MNKPKFDKPEKQNQAEQIMHSTRSVRAEMKYDEYETLRTTKRLSPRIIKIEKNKTINLSSWRRVETAQDVT